MGWKLGILILTIIGLGNCVYCGDEYSDRQEASGSCVLSTLALSSLGCDFTNSTSIDCPCIAALIKDCYNLYCVTVPRGLKELVKQKECAGVSYSFSARLSVEMVSIVVIAITNGIMMFI